MAVEKIGEGLELCLLLETIEWRVMKDGNPTSKVFTSYTKALKEFERQRAKEGV